MCVERVRQGGRADCVASFQQLKAASAVCQTLVHFVVSVRHYFNWLINSAACTPVGVICKHRTSDDVSVSDTVRVSLRSTTKYTNTGFWLHQGLFCFTSPDPLSLTAIKTAVFIRRVNMEVVMLKFTVKSIMNSKHLPLLNLMHKLCENIILASLVFPSIIRLKCQTHRLSVFAETYSPHLIGFRWHLLSLPCRPPAATYTTELDLLQTMQDICLQ